MTLNLRITPFRYNGFAIIESDKTPTCMARFIEKTKDPGMVVVQLVNKKYVIVPTCQIEGNMPKVSWTNCFEKGSDSLLFGMPSFLKIVKGKLEFSEIQLNHN